MSHPASDSVDQREEAETALQAIGRLEENSERFAEVRADYQSTSRRQAAILREKEAALKDAVIGMSTLLADTPLTDEQNGYVRAISSSSSSLLGILNDIFDFSKIESNKMELESVPFHLVELIEDAVEMFYTIAREKDLKLRFEVEDNVPFALLGDPGRLRQVLVNLVGNALKFTHQGEVLIELVLMDLHMPVMDGLRSYARDSAFGRAQSPAVHRRDDRRHFQRRW